MDTAPEVDPLETIYAPPIPNEWRHDLAGYREMIAAADRDRYRCEQQAARSARAARWALMHPTAPEPPPQSFLNLPRHPSDIIEEKVRRLMAVLDARDKLAST